MIESQEEIKKETLKHACRNIQIIYEPGRTEKTAQDEQLLDAYLKLHDFEWKMQKTADELFKDFAPVNSKINTLREKLQKLKVTFNNCAKLADKLSDTSYIFEETSIPKLTESQVEMNAAIQDHHRQMLELYQGIQLLEKRLSDYHEADEDEMNNLYDVYSEISGEHYNNWENNSINIVDFDKEYDDFHNYKSAHEERRKTLIDYCNTALNNYATLNLENIALYGVWEEFLKRCNLLRTVADLHGRILGSNYN